MSINMITMIVLAIISFIIAPFMTVGTIFLLIKLKFLGVLFIIAGFLHMLYRINNIMPIKPKEDKIKNNECK